MITAYLFEKSGAVTKIKPEQIRPSLKSKKNLVWVDIEEPTNQDYQFILKDTFNFHPLSIEDCMRPLELPKVDVFDEHLFLVFHNVSSDSQAGYFKKSEVDFFLGENFLVTVHLHKSKTIELLMQKFSRSGNGKKKKTIQKTADFLLYEILDNFIDRYFPLLDIWDEQIEDIEFGIINNKSPRSLMNKLLSIKREILTMRKSIVPQRDVIKKVTAPDFPFINQKTTVYFKDVHDHILKVYSELEIQRDLLNSAFDAHRNLINTQTTAISNNINQVMQKLTIMSAIFLPLTFITGLYGMNFEVMPGTDHPQGFFILLGFTMFLSLVLINYFKKNKWM